MEIRNKPKGPDNETFKLGSVMDLRGMAASTPGRAPVPIEAMRIGRCRCGPDGCADSSCPGRADAIRSAAQIRLTDAQVERMQYLAGQFISHPLSRSIDEIEEAGSMMNALLRQIGGAV